ncbi:MAG: DUF3872 domain-containing protein, partial [Rikenellaceae bacterium]
MKRLKPILFTLCLSAGAALVVSCNDKIEVQQAYDFSLETMPLKDELFKGETAEIRCKLNREGNYKDATFTIRYFQTDGKGELRMDDGTIFLSNDSYPLNAEQFRLYYTSHCDEQQSIDIYIEDNFGQKKK